MQAHGKSLRVTSLQVKIVIERFDYRWSDSAAEP
jgi:hypothetical protein